MQPKRTALLYFLSGLCLLLLILLTSASFWIWKTHLRDLPNLQAFVVDTYNGNLVVGHTFPVVPIRNIQGDTLYTDFSEAKGGLVLLFNPSTCQPCLKWTFKALQHIHDNLEDASQFPIYAVTDIPDLFISSSFGRAFKLKYEIGHLLERGKLDRFFERTPLVLLVSSHNTVLQCHAPLQGKTQYSALFFEDLVFQRFPLYQIDIEGFAESPLKKVHGLSISDVIGGRYNFDDLF